MAADALPQTASRSRSPVRTRTTLSTSATQILPSPIKPVCGDFAMAVVTAWAASSETTMSTRILASSTASCPARAAAVGCPYCSSKPRPSVTVKPRPPSPVAALMTSSSFSGWMIAVISLMGYRLLRHGPPVEDGGARHRERLAGYPVMMPAQEQLRSVIPPGCLRHDHDHGGLGRAAAGGG